MKLCEKVSQQVEDVDLSIVQGDEEISKQMMMKKKMMMEQARKQVHYLFNVVLIS